MSDILKKFIADATSGEAPASNFNTEPVAPNMSEEQPKSKAALRFFIEEEQKRLAGQASSTEEAMARLGGPSLPPPKIEAIDADRPTYANGSSPTQALAESPLSAAERMQFSLFGNRKGIEKTLKEKFGEVRPDPRNPESFIVNDGGVWKQIDPDNSAWETTKNLVKMAGKSLTGQLLAETVTGNLSASEQETVGDVADVSKELGIAAASLGIGVATGGASLLAQGAAQVGGAGVLAGIETSMGRAIGTYEATTEEQLIDVGTEMLYALGGEVIGIGMQAGIKQGIKAAQKLSKNMGRWGNATKQLALQAYSATTGVPVRSLELALDEAGDKVSHILKRYSQANAEDAVFRISNHQLDAAEELMKSFENARNNIWVEGIEQAKRQAGRTKIAAGEMFAQNRKFGLEQGLLKVVKDGKTIPLNEAVLLDMTKLPKGFDIVKTNYEETIELLGKAGRDIPSFHAEREGFEKIQELVSRADMIGRHSKDMDFEQGAKLLKEMRQSSYSLKLRTESEGLDAAREVAEMLGNKFENGFNEAFHAKGAKEALETFKKTRDTWSEATDNGKIFLQTWDRYKRSRGDRNILANLTNDIVRSNGSKHQQTAGMEYILNNVMGEKGGAQAIRAKNVYKDIMYHDAAKSFVPLVGKGRALATLAAVGSFASGHTEAGASFSVAAALSSPRFAFKALRLAGKASQGQTPAALKSLAAGGVKTVNFMRNLGSKGLDKLANDEVVLRSVLQTMMRAPEAEQATEAEIYQGIGLGQMMTPRGQ